MNKLNKILLVILIVLLMFFCGVIGFKIAENIYGKNENDNVVENDDKVAKYTPLEDLYEANGSLNFISFLENKYYILMDNETVYNIDEVDKFLENVENNVSDVIRICCYERGMLKTIKDVEYISDYKFIIRTDNRWDATLEKEDRKIVVNEYEKCQLVTNATQVKPEINRYIHKYSLDLSQVVENVDVFDYVDVDIKDESGFELEVITNSTGERKVLLLQTENSNIDYDAYLYSCDANVIINGEKFDLRDALLSGKVTIEQILEKAEKDEKENKTILGLHYADGGSAEYHYEDYCILKFNTLTINPEDGTKDLYIGSSSMYISDIKELYYDKTMERP